MRPGIVALIQREVKAGLARAASGLVRRGLVRLAQADGFLQVEGYTDERFDEVEHWQGYGLTSRPPLSSEVLIAIAGQAGQSAIALSGTSRANRPTDLESDEVRLYGVLDGSDQGAVRMRSSGSIDLDAPKSGETVNVGGDSEFLAKGETLKSALDTFSASLGSATTVPQVAAAGTALGTAIASMLATKGKVS